MARRWRLRASHGRYVERTRILPVDQIPRPAQVRKVGKVLLVHGTMVSTAPATVLRKSRPNQPAHFTATGPDRGNVQLHEHHVSLGKMHFLSRTIRGYPRPHL